MYYNTSLILYTTLNKEEPVTSVNGMNPDTHKFMVLVTSANSLPLILWTFHDIRSHSPCILHNVSPIVIHRI